VKQTSTVYLSHASAAILLTSLALMFTNYKYNPTLKRVISL